VRRILSEIIFAAGVAATLWLMAHIGLRPIGQALANVGIGGVLLLTLAHAPTVVCLGVCWWLLAGAAGGGHCAKFIWGRLMRDASGDVLPFSPIGGYFLGVRAVALTGVSAVQAAVSGIVDIIVEQAAKAPYMIVSVTCFLWLAPHATLAGPIIGLLVVTVGLTAAAGLQWNSVRARLIKVVARVSRLWPGGAASDQPPAEAVLAEALAHRRRIVIAFCLQFAGWCMGAGEAWLALRLVGAPVGFGEAIAIEGVYAAIRTFAFAVPAAIGVQEGSFVALCGVFGIDAPMALAFSLVRRARDVVIGAPTVLAWQLMERERRSPRNAASRRRAWFGRATDRLTDP
jgi:putative membrane protein